MFEDFEYSSVRSANIALYKVSDNGLLDWIWSRHLHDDGAHGETKLGVSEVRAVAISETTVFAGGEQRGISSSMSNHRLNAYSRDDGELLWTNDISEKLSSNSVVKTLTTLEDDVVVCGTNGYLARLDGNDGSTIWDLNLLPIITQRIEIVDGKIVALDSNRLLVVEDDGNILIDGQGDSRGFGQAWDTDGTNLYFLSNDATQVDDFAGVKITDEDIFICSIDIDGNGVSAIPKPEGAEFYGNSGFARSGSRYYWTTWFPAILHSVDHSGGDLQSVTLGLEDGRAVDVDGFGNAWVCGQTSNSDEYPANAFNFCCADSTEKLSHWRFSGMSLGRTTNSLAPNIGFTFQSRIHNNYLVIGFDEGAIDGPWQHCQGDFAV